MSINPFRGDPAPALEKAKRRAADVTSNIEALKLKRKELLASPDDDNVADIQRINSAIAVEEANKAIYEAKVSALVEEVRRATFQEREKQRKEQIAKIKDRLAKREQIASDLMLAVSRVAHLYGQLMQNDEAESLWEFPRPTHGFAALDHRGIRRELSWQLHGLEHQFGLPPASSAGLGVQGVQSIGIDGVVRASNEAIVARLETVSLHDDLLDEAI